MQLALSTRRNPTRILYTGKGETQRTRQSYSKTARQPCGALVFSRRRLIGLGGRYQGLAASAHRGRSGATSRVFGFAATAAWLADESSGPVPIASLAGAEEVIE